MFVLKKLLGFAVLAGILLVAGSQAGVLSFFATADCSWSVVEIEGQTFDSLDQFKQAAERNGASFDQFDRQFDFRTRDGTLEAKSTDCGVEDAPSAASAADVVPNGGGGGR